MLPISPFCQLHNSQVSLDRWEGALSCINMHFLLKLRDWNLSHAKKVLSIKLQLFSTVQFNSFIDFQWANNSLVDNSSLYNQITASLLLSSGHRHVWFWENPTFGPSIRSVKCYLWFICWNLEKSICIYFLAQFWCFKMFALMRAGGCLEDFFFTDPSSLNILYFLFLLTPSILAFSKIPVLVKSGCFTITFFSLHSSQGSTFLNPFPLLLNFVIYFQLSSLYHLMISANFLWYLQSGHILTK